MSLAVGAAGGEEFVDADVDHDAGDAGEENAHEGWGYGSISAAAAGEGAEEEKGDGGADGFGEAAEDGIEEGLAAVAGGIKDGDGNADAFGDVVEGDGDGDGEADAGVLEGGEEGGKAFGEVVDADGQGGEKAHAHELVVPVGMVVDAVFLVLGGVLGLVFEVGQWGFGVVEGTGFGFGVDFVGVFGGGDEIVDQADEEHAAEEAGDVGPGAPMGAEGGGEFIAALDEDFGEGDVEHDAGGKSGGHGEEAVVGAVGGEGDHAADAGGHAGEEGEGECSPEVFHGGSEEWGNGSAEGGKPQPKCRRQRKAGKRRGR